MLTCKELISSSQQKIYNPTWLCSTQQHFNVTLFLLVSMCCVLVSMCCDMSKARNRCNEFVFVSLFLFLNGSAVLWLLFWGEKVSKTNGYQEWQHMPWSLVPETGLGWCLLVCVMRQDSMPWLVSYADSVWRKSLLLLQMRLGIGGICLLLIRPWSSG